MNAIRLAAATAGALGVALLSVGAASGKPPGIDVPCTGQADLVAAINTVNSAGGGTINLTRGCDYQLTSVDNSGENGLPVITTSITINGWQSTIESCDGGLGTMQVMKDTANWMNEKYGTSYDRATLTGNINIATGYLAWLARYFGDRYFNGDYSLAGDPVKIVLLDLVISAYQAGFGSVDNAMAAGQDLPNRWYVDTVEGLMSHQPWSAPSAGPP